MIPFIETFQRAVRRLEDANISYAIVGSIASTIYGEPRLTCYLDIVVDVKSQQASFLKELFGPLEYSCPPIEILGSEISSCGQFSILHNSTGLKIDLFVKKDTDIEQSCFDRRQQIEIWDGFLAYLASPEDVIIKKLKSFYEGGFEKHIRDIRGILVNSDLDQGYLKKWVAQLDLENEWKKV